MNRLIFKKILNFKIPKLQYNYIGESNRCYSDYYNFDPTPKKILSQREVENYQSYFPEIVEYLTASDETIHPEVNQYFKEILNYNLSGQTHYVGSIVVATFKHFADLEKQTSENMRLAYIMGWVADMLVNSVQIVDDILDSSTTRENKLCWYKNDNVGLAAITHANAIENGAYMVLNHFLSEHSSYVPILQLTQEIYLKFTFNVIFDKMSKDKFKYFTEEKYNITVSHKGAYFALVHPVCTGMYLAEVHDPNLHSEIRSLFLVLAQYICAQNDIRDCYGNFETSGKQGTDIMLGKCTWLAIQAMMDANSSQIEAFKNNYGKSDPESQTVIYNLYEELDILNKFLMYEKESYNRIQGMVENMSVLIPKELLYQIINPIFGNIKK